MCKWEIYLSKKENMGKYKAIIFRSLYKEAMTEDITKEC